MSDPPAKKRRIRENKSNVIPFPAEMWKMIGNYLEVSNVDRMGDLDPYIKKAVEPLLACSQIIGDGRVCFTQRRIGDSKDTYRTRCPVVCDAYKGKYLRYIIDTTQDMMMYHETYSVLYNGQAHDFDSVDVGFVFRDGTHAIYAGDGWLLHSLTDTTNITQMELINKIIADGRLKVIIDYNLNFVPLERDFHISFVIKMGEGWMPLAPVFEDMLATKHRAEGVQNLQGPETAYSDSHYVFEKKWKTGN